MADEKIKTGPTWIHGNASNQQIDSSGEIVDLAGLDCSSLTQGCFNWEHQNTQPNQVVGKILEYKKIFSETDCENEHHKYFWDKCKVPYLYVMGRLFDDKKESSKEVAALFVDDAEHPDEPPMIGFSIEGSKINRTGIIVDKSIARRVTCTGTPCNKACIAELVPNPNLKQESDTDSIFKSEASFTIELLSKAEEFKPMNKKEVPGSKFPASQPAQAQSKPVKGAPGWSHTGGGNFSHPEHGVVSVVKEGPQFNVKHGGGLAGIGGKKGSFSTAQEAGAHAGNYIRSLGQGKTQAPKMQNRPSPNMDKSIVGGMMGAGLPQESTDKKNKRGLFNPDVDKISGRGMMVGGMVRSEKNGNLNKAMTAGSGMASPGSLIGGAALAPESLDRKMKKAEPLEKAKVDEGKSLEEKVRARQARNTRDVRTVKDSKGNDFVDRTINENSRRPTIRANKLEGHDSDNKVHPRRMGEKIVGNQKGISPRKGGPSYMTGHAQKGVHQEGSGRGESQAGNILAGWSGVSGAKDKHKEVLSELRSMPKPKLDKSEWLARAEQEYARWEKREQFENFMAKHMPSLTKGEVTAIGQTLALRKSLRAEKKLAKMVTDQGQDSWVKKKE